ncbi:MAG: hypothetical protein KGV50_03825 [Gammaproteobacteria bacterium]|nr:hypothetical protein [Gammaproteobacteria bacterium]
MRITIDYESSWRNSFLDGSNDESLPKKGRNFVASLTELKKEQNYINRSVTQNTVLGILSRLIGDQRKLYHARRSDNYYFADIEDAITFEDKPSVLNQEIVYIRNMKGSTDQNSFTGMIKVNDAIFQSDYSQQFWGVLSLSIDDLCKFILQDTKVENAIALDPVSILNRLDAIKKMKPVEHTGVIKEASDELVKHFEKYKPLNKKEQQLLLPLYCSALYMQMRRLEQHYDMSNAKSKMGGISGISNNGFTPKDFMGTYTTGAKKLIYGSPFIREEFVKGEGKIKHTLTKANGQLEIKIDFDGDEGREDELWDMIENAGVSSFYLGKKGLAYVSDIQPD